MMNESLLWLRWIGWVFFAVPLIGYAGFSVWMILETIKDDTSLKAFVGTLGIIWIAGAVMLALGYLV